MTTLSTFGLNRQEMRSSNAGADRVRSLPYDGAQVRIFDTHEWYDWPLSLQAKFLDLVIKCACSHAQFERGLSASKSVSG